MTPVQRAGVAAIAVVVVVAGAVIGIRAWWSSANRPPVSESCTFGSYALDTGQASVAATMVGVVVTRGLPERAAVLTIAGALQESKLRNVPSGSGDRDSVGVLQQRPSQGWGTVAQLSDLHYATGAFLDALVKVSGWQTMPLAQAIQEVQRSPDGSLYAKHEGEAEAVADAFTGSRPAAISCTFPKPSQVATSDNVGAQLAADLPVRPPSTTAGSLQVPGASWATTSWLIANADRLGIESVSYAQRTWARSSGWRTDTAASSANVTATMYKQ